MTREDYVRALESIRDIVRNDLHIPTDTSAAILVEIARAMPAEGRPPKYGEYDQCVVCNHTPAYCSC